MDPLADQALWAVGLEETLTMFLLQYNCHLKYVRIFSGAAIFTSHPGWLISQNATFSNGGFCGAVVAREVTFITNVLLCYVYSSNMFISFGIMQVLQRNRSNLERRTAHK